MNRRDFFGFWISGIGLPVGWFSCGLAAGVCLLSGTPGWCADDLAWRAGVARADITPKEPMWLAGYAARDHEAEGMLHPLWAKALAIEDAAGHRAVLVTSDHLGYPKNMSDPIRDRLEKEYGLSRAQIILSSSHTHSGPVLRDSISTIYPLTPEQVGKVEQYSADLEARTVELAGEALKNLAPARLWAGNGVARFAVNRRNNPEAEITRLFDFKGPVDHAVPVLKVAREDGSLLAVAFGYACHATTLDICQWSGDYPGFAQIALEAAHPGATAMFFAGCGADQNPLPRRSVELARQYGNALAGAVERVLAENAMRPLESSLATEYAELELGLMPAPSREDFQKMAREMTGWQQRAVQRLLAVLESGKPLPETRSFPAQVWRVGDQAIATLGGEVVVDYAVSIKQLLGNETFVLGYSNDLVAYIPSVRVLREGGYEGETSQIEYDLPSKWREDIEPRILSAVRELAQKAGITPNPAVSTGR